MKTFARHDDELLRSIATIASTYSPSWLTEQCIAPTLSEDCRVDASASDGLPPSLRMTDRSFHVSFAVGYSALYAASLSVQLRGMSDGGVQMTPVTRLT